LFAIADGVGEDASGSEAARTVTGVLAGAVPLGPIESLTQEIKGKLGRAHGLLQSAAVPQERRGATASVVALAVSEYRFAAVWAGDARAYLLRHGMMRALTRDHVAIGLRRTLSRGIGLRGPLSPEVCTDAVQDDDRFLLCSNPLVLALGERGIAELILSVERKDAVEALVQEALIAGCRHNISAMIVDVRAHGR
jgi:type VI secretion system protein ImpM